MSCAIIIARGGLGECLSHGWVLKRWRGQMEPLLPGLPGPRWGSWKAARAQAEVKRSRSQGSRHIPRGLPLRWQEDAPSGSKAGPGSRRSRKTPKQAKGSKGRGFPFLALQEAGGVWRRGVVLGAFKRRGCKSSRLEIRRRGVRLSPSAWEPGQGAQPTSCRCMRSVRLCCMQVSWIRSWSA